MTVLEALKIVKNDLGYEVSVGNTVGGPFTTAAMLIGTENFLNGFGYWDLENIENEWMSEEFWTTLGYDPINM